MAIEKLSRDIKIKRGKVTFIIANKEALKKNVRFVESNLNKSFDTSTPSTLEEKTAQDIKKILDIVDAMLDIHASSSKDTSPFAICEEHSLEVVRALPLQQVLIGIDKFHGGSTDKYMNKQGKVGVCVECGYLGDLEETTRIAIAMIESFLAQYGIIEGKTTNKDQKVLRAIDQYMGVFGSFKPAKSFSDFQMISKGDIIGYDGGRPVRAEKKQHILFARETKEIGEECFLIAEYL